MFAVSYMDQCWSLNQRICPSIHLADIFESMSTAEDEVLTCMSNG